MNWANRAFWIGLACAALGLFAGLARAETGQADLWPQWPVTRVENAPLGQEKADAGVEIFRPATVPRPPLRPVPWPPLAVPAEEAAALRPVAATTPRDLVFESYLAQLRLRLSCRMAEEGGAPASPCQG